MTTVIHTLGYGIKTVFQFIFSMLQSVKMQSSNAEITNVFPPHFSVMVKMIVGTNQMKRQEVV